MKPQRRENHLGYTEVRDRSLFGLDGIVIERVVFDGLGPQGRIGFAEETEAWLLDVLLQRSLERGRE